VNLLTLHSTKGLEFSRVYVVGAEDGEMLGGSATRPPSDAQIEEARRLLYVGMTRAKDRLVFTHARERGERPGGGHRFLDEMGIVPSEPRDLVAVAREECHQPRIDEQLLPPRSHFS